MKKLLITIGVILMATKVMAAAEFKPDSNMPRNKVPNEFKWNTSEIFKSDAEWQADYKKVEKALDGLSIYKGKLANPDSLKACMEAYKNLHLIFDKLSIYSNLKNVEDEAILKYDEMRKQQLKLVNLLNEKSQFIKQEVLKLGDVSDPKLTEYRPYLDEILRRKDTLLGPEAEKVLGIFNDNLWSEVDLNELPSDVEQVFKAVQRDLQLPKIRDENGKEVQLTLSNYSKYRASKDRNVRKETVTAFFGALRKYQNIMAATLSGEFKRDVNLARARKYSHAVDAYLDREDIDPTVIDNLIKTIHKNFAPLHRYIELRKKILKLPDIHIYDLYTPIVASAESEITFDQASKAVTEALKPLGDEYLSILTKAIDPRNGWVDVYPNKGKESGAFATSIWAMHPFVKMNFQNSVDDASTLAHEYGHAMHFYLNQHAQPYMNFGTSTLAAEIASTFNEMMFSNYMLEKNKDDKNMRLYLLGERIETIRQTVYRQTMFAEFEKKVHEFIEKGMPISAELLNKTYKDLLRQYFGPGFTIDENDEIEWSYIPHFYWKFYVYSYAAGLSSGIAMVDNITTQGAEARDRYLAMLKAPRSDKPIDTIKKAGVDLTKPASIEAAAKLMNKTIEEMETLIK